MATMSPQEYARKLVARASAASGDYSQGVQRVTTSPTQAAKAAIPKMMAKLQEANTSGKIARGLDRVSLEDWKKSASTKGAERFAGGVQAAAPKIEAFAAEFLPFQESVTSKVRSMPSTTLEQNIARAAEQIRGTAQFRRSR